MMARASLSTLGSAGRWVAIAVVVFVIALILLGRINNSGATGAGRPVSLSAASDGPSPAKLNDPEAQIASLQTALREDPTNVEALGLLGDAYYAEFRETADPTLLARAQKAFEGALAIEPRDIASTIGQGTLALSRHDFHGGLQLGLKAHNLAPALVQPYSLIADAEIELGRYGAAGRTLQRLVNLKPSLSAYARISYFRELNGDIPGAIGAMRLAVSAGGGGEPLAYVQTLLGRLELDQGRYRNARSEYGRALEENPDYTPAAAGLARVDAAEGSLDSSIRRYRDVVERLPLPEYAIALAETELAAGRQSAARQDLNLVRVEEKLFRAAGVDVGSELAVFEADHGSPERAVRFGAQAWHRAPSVRSADAYSWALNSAGRTDAALRYSRRAMHLGSRDPNFLYHAGQIARAAGMRDLAASYLGTLVAQSPGFNPLFAPRAERALRAVR